MVGEKVVVGEGAGVEAANDEFGISKKAAVLGPVATIDHAALYLAWFNIIRGLLLLHSRFRQCCGKGLPPNLLGKGRFGRLHQRKC